jgi:hypothetical protein
MFGMYHCFLINFVLLNFHMPYGVNMDLTDVIYKK